MHLDVHSFLQEKDHCGLELRILAMLCNYVGDTLLYGGTVLLLAAAMPKGNPASRVGSRETVTSV
jgi:hypothetical protein